MFRASAFKLKMFETCAQQYKFTYIDHLDKEYKTPKPYLTMGAHVHNALYDLYDKVDPAERNYERLEQLLRSRWKENRQGFRDREDEAKWGVKALQMLRLFAHRMDTTITPVVLEDFYDADLNETIQVIGRVDRADQLEDGSLHVIDYKTGKFDPDDQSDLQLILYAMIISSSRKQAVSKASYLYLPTWDWYTIEIDDAAIDEAIYEVTKRVEGIKAESEYKPEPNKYCKNCDFLEICPAKQEIQVLIDSGEL